MRREYLIWLVCVSLSWSTKAQLAPPPSGVTVDKLFTVASQTSIPARCIAYVQPGRATVILDKELLEQRSKSKVPWREHYEMLLGISDGSESVLGCTPVWNARGAEHIFTTALENGEATVVEAGATVPIAGVIVRYRGTAGAGGFVLYYTRSDQPPFLIRTWWIS
jgi:hypothetical protein